MEVRMTKNQPHQDQPLNQVDVSLHEFLGAAWNNSTRSATNPAALEMLLAPIKDAIQASPAEADMPSSTLRQRRLARTSKAATREQALEKRQYLRALKFTYPSLWYAVRLSHAVFEAGTHRALRIVSPIVWPLHDLWTLLWTFTTTPPRYLTRLLIGDQYDKAEGLIVERLKRNRLWLGRHRGNNYFSAFYHRCFYVVTCVRALHFYAIDDFFARYLTIRRGLQALLPIGVFCSILQQTTTAPQLVYSRGLENVSNTLAPDWKSYDPVETVITADMQLEMDTIDAKEPLRMDSDMLVWYESGLQREFIPGSGKFGFVEKIVQTDFLHPWELVRITSVSPEMTQTDVKTGTLKVMPVYPDRKFGEYDYNAEEESRIPKLPERGPEEAELDPTQKEAALARLRDEYVPSNPYTMVRGHDGLLIEPQPRTIARQLKRQLEKVTNDFQNEKVVETGEATKELKAAVKAQRKRHVIACQKLKGFKQMSQLLSYNVDNNGYFVTDLMGAIYAYQPYFVPNSDANLMRDTLVKALNRRVAISPFGLTLEREQPTPGTLRPFSKQEMKLMQYAFLDSPAALTAFEYHVPPEILPQNVTSEGIQISDIDPIASSMSNVYNTLTKQDVAEMYAQMEAEDFDEEEFAEDEDNGFEEAFGNETDESLAAPINAFSNGFADVGTEDTPTSGTDQSYNTIASVDTAETEDEEGTNNDMSYVLAPTWMKDLTLFISPTPGLPWQSTLWKQMAIPLVTYAVIEFCIRLECRGLRVRLNKLGQVHRLFPHLNRMSEAAYAREYIGETFNSNQVRQLRLAFQAKRGSELYGQSQWHRVWERLVRPYLSEQQEAWVKRQGDAINLKLEQIWDPEFGVMRNGDYTVESRNVMQQTAFPRNPEIHQIAFRYFGMDKVTESINAYLRPSVAAGGDGRTLSIAEHQQRFNLLGGEMVLSRGLVYGAAVQDEICHFPLLALIKPGTSRMSTLPKGMILLGDAGNGRSYFVRTLATEARLPLLVTESNRYLDATFGIVRLKTLFKRALRNAPNIVFIRDMDFMTRSRERYTSYTSVRATAQLLLSMDGYTSTPTQEMVPGQQDIFVMGGMTTTSMMDEACMRSGRFEWLLHFYYPPQDERQQMFMVHSTHSIVNTAIDVDWAYFTAMTENFSCLDLRTIMNTSALYALQRKSTVHTTESVAFALGHVNHIHDLYAATLVPANRSNFFLRRDFVQRRRQMMAYAPFFTQTGHVPMYKKLMHLFRVMAPTETQRLASQWSRGTVEQTPWTVREPDRTLLNGLLPFFCEGLFLYNTQKACGSPYPFVVFDTYYSPLFRDLKYMLDTSTQEHALERTTTRTGFITTFDLWRRAHPSAWTRTGRFDGKALALRTKTTTLWRHIRLAPRFAMSDGVTEVENEVLCGPPPLATKIKNRVQFLADKIDEHGSLDTTLFGTFETHSDLAFKCRKPVTARRVRQVSVELVDVMQKHWRQTPQPMQSLRY